MIALGRVTRFGLPLTLVLIACQAAPATDAGDPPYTFLESRVEAALRHVEDARVALGSDRAEEARSPLEAASVGLRKVQGYYLPLLEARFHVGRAVELSTTSPDDGRAAIESARLTLDGVATSHGEHLARGMQEPLAKLEEARTRLESGERDEARGILQRLHQQLEVLFFRGELVLEGSELDSPPPAQPPD